MKYYAKFLPLAVGFSIILYGLRSYMSADGLSLQHYIVYNHCGELIKFTTAEMVLRIRNLLPYYTYAIIFSTYIYRHFCYSSVYIFSRCQKRGWWFRGEAVKLLGYTVIYVLLLNISALPIVMMKYQISIDNVEVIKVPKPSIDNDFFSCTDLFYYKRRDDGSSDPIKKVKFTTALNTDILKRLAECESYEVSSKDPHFKSVDGMIYSKDGKTLVRIPLGRKKVVISDKCSTVATRSYGYRTYGMSVLREIVFPKSVVKITSDNDLNFDISHYKCENIKVSLNMSQLDNKSIQRLWTTNKYWKKSLKNELLRKGFASLNEKNERMLMLADGYLCSYLKKEETDTDETETREDIVGLVIPDNVKTIGTEAFSEYDISYITLENGVEFIEDYAFEGYGLKDENDNWYAVVYVKRDNIHISDKAFAGGESVRIVMEK